MLILSLSDMALRVVDLLQQGRAELDDTNSQLSKDRVVDAINSYYSALNVEAQMGSRPRPELIAYRNAVRSSSTEMLDITYNPMYGQLIGITRMDVGDTTPKQNETLMALSSIAEGAGFANEANFKIVGNQIIVLNPSGDYYRTWWIRNPGPLHQGTLASGATYTSIVFGATATYGSVPQIDDVHNGDLIYFPDGNAAGEHAIVSDYDGGTRTATLSPLQALSGNALTTPPANGDGYSIVPWFSLLFGDLLPYLAATQFTRLPSRDEIVPGAESRLGQFRNWLSRVDLSTPRRVVVRGQVDFGVGNSARRVYLKS